MNLETEICKVLADVFHAILIGFEIHGNWLPEGGVKGVEVFAGKKFDISVGARRHDGYSSPMVEMSVTLEGSLAVADDVSMAATVHAYDAVVAKLESWHRDISTVKADLSVADLFVPVGMKLDGGTLEIDRDTKTRTFTQQFTLKGRIIQQ